MFSCRFSNFAGLLIVAGLMGTNSAFAQTTTVFDDTFDDGERLAVNLPSSIAWYQNVLTSAGNTQGGNLAVRNGTLVFTVADASRTLWSYFPKVKLDVGERITFLMDFVVTAPASTFRVGLCYTNGETPRTSDGPGPTGGYQGYGLENLFVIKRSGVAAANPDATLVNNLSIDNQPVWERVVPNARGVQGMPLQANIAYTLAFNVARTGANTANITVALTGGGLTTANTVTVADPANIFTTFDTIGIGFVGNAMNGDMLVSRASVVTTGEIEKPKITARLSNLSILTSVTSPGDSFTMGYVVGGAGTGGSKPILIRAAGPTLGAAPFNISGVLADPKLELFAGSAPAGANDNWGGTTTLSAAFTAVGAFPYVNNTSLDAAVLANISAGDNSVRVSASGNGTGIVIAELYDSTPFANMAPTSPRLVNVSVLKHLGTGLTIGFVIDGSGAKRVLIRAVGPTIGAAPFNVPGAVADPQLTLFSGQTVIGTNDNWGGTAELSTAFTQVGAFALPPTSRDAALTATLNPGSYTVQVSGVGGTTGVAIVEVYEIP